MEKLPIENKKEMSDTGAVAQQPAPSLAAAVVDPACEEAHKNFVSAGKRIHNEITYRGVDWLLNSAVGVAFAYWASRTKSGQRLFSDNVSGFFKKAASTLTASENAINESAKWGTKFTAIMIGGFSIIPIMMGLENKNIKKKIVRSLDEKIYGKEAVENDPKFEESYRKIDEEPKKGFWAGMASRVMALAPIILIVSIPKTNKPLIKYIYDPIAKGSKWAAAKVGIKPGKMAVEGALEHLNGDPNTAKEFQSNWDFLHRTIGFDFGLTIFYSILHEFSYKALAAMGVKNAKSVDSPNEVELVKELGNTAHPELAACKPENRKNWVESVEKSKKQIVPTASYQDALANTPGSGASVTI